jgi:hypothetical protein
MNPKLTLLVTTSLVALIATHAEAGSFNKRLLLTPPSSSPSGASKSATQGAILAQGAGSHSSDGLKLTTKPIVLNSSVLKTVTPVKITTPTVLTNGNLPIVTTLKPIIVPPTVLTNGKLPIVNTIKPIVASGTPVPVFGATLAHPLQQGGATPLTTLNSSLKTISLQQSQLGAFAKPDKLMSKLSRLGDFQYSKPTLPLQQAQQLHTQSLSLLKVNTAGTVSKESIDRFVAINKLTGNAATLTNAIGTDKFKSVLGKINDSLASGEYKIVPIVGAQNGANPSPSTPKGGQAGDNSTIVIDKSENGKTVYVPADQLSGPDKRTIVVDCKNCKVVVVGDNAGAGSTVDDRKIVVNGKGDQVTAQGDTANATAPGQAGGTITDDRQITVNGSKDKILDGGDSSAGANGMSGGTKGQAGGSGGTINDNRSVVVDGNHDKVTSGTDKVSGGNGGSGTVAGGDGGSGGTINDNRTADINGNHDTVDMGGSLFQGGNGGDGAGGSGGNGGKGGMPNDNRTVNDNGHDNATTYGNDVGIGGNGGNG